MSAPRLPNSSHSIELPSFFLNSFPCMNRETGANCRQQLPEKQTKPATDSSLLMFCYQPYSPCMVLKPWEFLARVARKARFRSAELINLDTWVRAFSIPFKIPFGWHLYGVIIKCYCFLFPAFFTFSRWSQPSWIACILWSTRGELWKKVSWTGIILDSYSLNWHHSNSWQHKNKSDTHSENDNWSRKSHQTESRNQGCPSPSPVKEN